MEPVRIIGIVNYSAQALACSMLALLLWARFRSRPGRHLAYWALGWSSLAAGLRRALGADPLPAAPA